MRVAWLVVAAGCGRLGFDPRTSDGAVADVTPDVLAASTCPQPGTLVCESFDLTVTGPWQVQTNMGDVGYTNGRPFRGAGSLVSHTNPVDAAQRPKAQVRTSQNISGAPSGMRYARVWVYLSSPLPASFNQFLTFADFGGTGIGLGVRSTGVLASNDFTDGTFLPSTTLMPVDRWTCITLEIPSGQTGMTRVYLDDVEVADIAQPNSTPQTPVDQIYVGTEWVSNSVPLPDVTAWYDELIVDDAPVSCAQ